MSYLCRWKFLCIVVIISFFPAQSVWSNLENGVTSQSINTTQTEVGKKKTITPEASNKLAYKVNQFSGTLGYQIPFVVPEGRSGMTPSVGLGYSSSTKMSWPARGWSLPSASIHRETKFGKPKYDDDSNNTDIFIFSGFGRRLRLVPWIQDGEDPNEVVRQSRVEYRAKIESAFYRFIYYKNAGTDKRWEIWQKNGTVHRLGTTDGSRKSFDNQDKIFAWYIDKSIDTNGNTIDYSYVKGFTAQNQGNSLYFYPSKIAYGGNDNTNFAHVYEIRFILSANIGNEHSKLNSGYKELINHKKLDAIELHVKESPNSSFSLRKKLYFHYTTLGNTGGDDILEKVQFEGINSNGTLKQEPIKFEYYSGVDATNSGSKLHPPDDISGSPSTSFLTKNYYQTGAGRLPGQFTLAGFIDLNGDGLQDFVRTDAAQDNDKSALFIDTDGDNSNSSGWYPQAEGYKNNTFFSWKVWFQKKDGSFASPVKWYFNGVNNSIYQTGCRGCAIRWTTSSLNNSSIVEDTFDIDGDGRPDHVITNRPSNGTGTVTNQWCRNNGKGFDSCQPLSIPLSELGQTLSNLRVSVASIIDLTGDGRPDLLHVPSAGASNAFFNIYKGTNQGFVANPTQWANPISLCGAQRQYLRCYIKSPSNITYTLQDLIDLNGDGLPDRIFQPYVGEQFALAQVYFNNGSGFESIFFQTSNIAFNKEQSNSSMQNRVRQMTDIDGDGLVDIVARDDSSDSSELKLNIWFNQGVKGTLKRFSSNPVQWTISTSGTRYLNYTQVLSPCGNTGNLCDYGVTSMLKDLNGDGKVDLVYIENGTWKIQKGDYPPPYMLKSVQNGHGLKATFTYKPSTSFNDDSTLPNPNASNIPYKIPYTMHLVSSVKTEDFGSPSETVTYHYANGKYDYVEREFRGFRTVTVENSQGRQDIFTYAQGEYTSGILEGHTVKDKSTGGFYRYTTNTIHESVIPNNTTPIIKFPFVKEKLIEYLEGIYTPNALSAKRKYYGYRYDNNGNITHQADFTRGHCSKTTYKSKNSLTEYIFAKKEVESIPNAIYSATIGFDICPGTPERKTTFYHDGTSDKDYITKGNLKLTQSCIDSSCNMTSDTSFTHDSYGNVLSTTDPNGNTSLSYFGSGTHYLYPEYITNALGHQQYFSYDLGLGKVLSIRGPNSTDPNNVATQGEERKFEYDPLGRIKKKYVPHFEVVGGNSSYVSKVLVEFSYSPLGAQIPHFVETVNFKKFVQGQTQGTEPMISVVYYNGRGKTIQTRSIHIGSVLGGSPVISVSDIEYDSLGRTKRTVRPYAYSGTSSWSYTAPTWNNATTYEYDLLHRVKKVEHPGNAWNHISYEYAPWRTKITDEEGKIKEYVYNAIGKLSEVVEHEYTLLGSSFSTFYGYTKWGELSSITDSEGNIVSYTYDNLGRRTSRFQFPAYNSGATWSENHFYYDNAGNLTGKLDNQNEMTSYAYDSLNRVTSTTYSPVPMPWFGGSNGGSSGNWYPLGNISYTYDQGTLHHIGRLSRVDDETGHTSFEYDAQGRLAKKTISICLNGSSGNCSSPKIYTQEMEYHAFGGMHTATYGTGSNPVTIKYDFDDAGRVSQVYLDSPNQPVFAKFYYNPDGTLHTKTSPKTTDSPPGFNTTVQYNYNERGFITSVLGTKITDPGYVFLHSNYQYLKSGHIRFYQDLKNGIEVSYEYDDLYRLIGMNSEQIGNRSYQYSMNGNILEKTQTDPSNGVTTAWYYGYNTHSPWAGGYHGPHAATTLVNSTGTKYYQYHYGYNGNMKMKDNTTSSSELWRYYYDLENKLRRVNLVDKSSGNISSETTFRYRYNGSRIHKTTIQGGVTTQDKIYIDGAFEHDLQLDTYDVHVFAVGTRIATIRNAAGSSLVYLYHKNNVQNTKVITDNQGNIADQRGYFPFGAEYNSVAGFQNSTSGLEYRFNDKEFDSETGVYYYGARYYEPELSKWLSSDKYYFSPRIEGLLNPQKLNLYSFSLNNPVYFYDPDGRNPKKGFWDGIKSAAQKIWDWTTKTARRGKEKYQQSRLGEQRGSGLQIKPRKKNPKELKGKSQKQLEGKKTDKKSGGMSIVPIPEGADGGLSTPEEKKGKYPTPFLKLKKLGIVPINEAKMYWSDVTPFDILCARFLCVGHQYMNQKWYKFSDYIDGKTSQKRK